MDRSTSSQVFAADGSRLGYIQSDVVRTPGLDRRGSPTSSSRRRSRSRTSASTSTAESTSTRSRARRSRTSRPARSSRAARRSHSSSSATSISATRSATSAQDQRGDARRGARGRPLEELDPRAVPQHRLLRDDRGPNLGRRRVGVPDLLQQAGPGAEAHRVRAARWSPSVTVALQPTNQPHRRAGASQPGAPEDGRAGLHHRRCRGPGLTGGPRHGAWIPLHDDPRALLLRLRAAGPDQPLRGRHRPPGRAQGVHHDPAPAPGGGEAGDHRPRLYLGSGGRGDRLDRSRRTETSWRWRRRAPIRRATSTSPPRATASRARR